MPRLHAAVTALNAYDTGDIPPCEVDLDEGDNDMVYNIAGDFSATSSGT